MKKNESSGAESPVLWGGRLSKKPETEPFEFQASLHIDRRLVFDDIAGSRAHVDMLGKCGIITRETAGALERELAKIDAELRRGELAIDEKAEDIHTFVEDILTARLGDLGRMVHSGRSRNDQIVTDLRLYLKHEVPELCAGLRETMSVLLDRAEEHLESIMPGYTHLQRAQPVTLGYHLTAWVCALRRDLARFTDALTRLDECPLGSGALAGSSLPLDRQMVSNRLEFARPALNAMDAVASRDFVAELASNAAITQTHLSRFCEDIVIWATEEFKFIDIAEEWSTGSSIMPQKKNPDFAELIRGKSARVTGNLVTLLTLLKGLPSAYNKDLQEDKEALFDSLDTVKQSLRMFRGMMQSARWNTAAMENACAGGFLEATDVAEYLTAKGLPFRKAHDAAAHIVRDCIAAGEWGIACRTIAQLKQYSSLFEEDLYEKLSPRTCVEARALPGGPAPREVRKQIEELRAALRPIQD